MTKRPAAPKDGGPGLCLYLIGLPRRSGGGTRTRNPGQNYRRMPISVVYTGCLRVRPAPSSHRPIPGRCLSSVRTTA